jgi:hypothetical protein
MTEFGFCICVIRESLLYVFEYCRATWTQSMSVCCSAHETGHSATSLLLLYMHAETETKLRHHPCATVNACPLSQSNSYGKV